MPTELNPTWIPGRGQPLAFSPSQLEKRPAAVFQTLLRGSPAKSVVFAGCTGGAMAHAQVRLLSHRVAQYTRSYSVARADLGCGPHVARTDREHTLEGAALGWGFSRQRGWQLGGPKLHRRPR